MSPTSPLPRGLVTPQEPMIRDEDSKLHVIIIGAGLGGLGAAISILLAGHVVTVLEAAPEIGEVGAGIQVLPNAAKVLFSWGLEDVLEQYATKPAACNFLGWRGNHLSSMDYHGYARATGAPFLDFHRATLHRCLLDRAVALGATIVTNARVESYSTSPGPSSSCTVTLSSSSNQHHASNPPNLTGDLVVAADGINSTIRPLFLSLSPQADPATPTGDLAYRLLLPAAKMLSDPELRPMVEHPQVNYWVGPGAHAVSYVLRGGELFNVVLLVPDDETGEAEDNKNISTGTAAEMRAHFEGWDPRLQKLAALYDGDGTVLKWKLRIRPGLDPKWYEPESGALVLLGDAVHATLPYLASGAGMALEDAGVLGLCLGRLRGRDAAAKREALKVFEACRRVRTEEVVRRGTYNQWIYHLPDGEEQEGRDQKFAEYGKWEKEWLGGEQAPVLPRLQETGDDPFPWRYHGVGRWLLTYSMWEDVERKWNEVCGEAVGMETPQSRL